MKADFPHPWQAEMLRGIMVDEAAVDRKTGAMTAKSSEILEQKFASLALAADAGVRVCLPRPHTHPPTH